MLRRSNTGRLFLLTFILVGLAFPLLPFSVNAAAPAVTSFTLRVSPPLGEEKTIQRAALLNTVTFSNVSGLADNVYTGTYDPDDADNDRLACRATLYYTLDGSMPNVSRPQTTKLTHLFLQGVLGGCNDLIGGNEDAPGTYTGKNIPANLSIPPSNTQRVVRFIVQVNETGFAGGQAAKLFCDPIGTPDCNNGGLAVTKAYNYTIDSTRPALVAANQAPPSFPSTYSNTEPVEFNMSRANPISLGFRVADNPAQTKLNFSTLAIKIVSPNPQGTRTHTTNFTRTTDADGRGANFAFNYATAFPTCTTCGFVEGQHIVNITLRDYGGNQMNGTPTTQREFKFHVDKTPPQFAGLTVTPTTWVQNGTTRVTARGVPVNVTVDITDPHMNLNSLTDVTVELFNTTRQLTTGQVAMKHWGAANKWSNASTLIIPPSWPAQEFNMSVRVTAKDVARKPNNQPYGNPNTTLAAGNNIYRLDPTLPIIVPKQTPPLGTYRSAGPYYLNVTVTDTNAGIEGVNATISNVTGEFAVNPVNAPANQGGPWTCIGTPAGAQCKVFKKSMTRTPNTNNWSAQVPSGKDGAVIHYNLTAKDRAGNTNKTQTFILRVDRVGPGVNEVDKKTYRGLPPNTLRFVAPDAISGPDPAKGVLWFKERTAGAYTKVVMTYNATSATYAGVITKEFAHGKLVDYYAEVTDVAGNLGTYGNTTKPKNFTVDAKKPTTTINVPATDADGQFVLTATVSDTPAPTSGIREIVMQARVKTPDDSDTWVTISPPNNTNTTLSICLTGPLTYQFRAWAIDNAANKGDPSAAKTTEVTGVGCAQQVNLVILSPRGATIDSDGGRAIVPIEWSALASRTLTSPALIRIKIEFSPDDGQYWVTLRDDLPNTGLFNWTVLAPSCDLCLLRLTGSLPDGTTDNDTAPFEITNGQRTADLDANGIWDSCEIRAFGRLGVADPDADPDEDGLTTERECRLGTHPLAADTDGDGYSDGQEVRIGTDPTSASSFPSKTQLRSEQFDSAYFWILPALFLLVVLLFAVGMTRRW